MLLNRYFLFLTISMFGFYFNMWGQDFRNSLDNLQNSVFEKKMIESFTWDNFVSANNSLTSYELSKGNSHLQKKLGERYPQFIDIIHKQIKDKNNVSAGIQLLSQLIQDKKDIPFLIKLLFDRDYSIYRSDIFIGLGYLQCDNVEEDLIFRLTNAHETPTGVTEIVKNKKSWTQEKFFIIEAKDRDNWVSSHLRVLSHLGSKYPYFYVNNNFPLPGWKSESVALSILLEEGAPIEQIQSFVVDFLSLKKDSNMDIIKAHKSLDLLIENSNKLKGNHKLNALLTKMLKDMVTVDLRKVALLLKKTSSSKEFSVLSKSLKDKSLLYKGIFKYAELNQ